MEYVAIKKTDDNELMHHGVMGMKWGVRRYQNADGTLTAKGRSRMMQISSDARLQKKETNKALKAYSSTGSMASQRHSLAANKAYKLNKKSEKAAMKGDKVNSEKYKTKAKEYAKRAESELKTYKAMSEKISQINSGTIKAGRDFMTQTDRDFYLLPGALLWTTNTTVVTPSKRK